MSYKANNRSNNYWDLHNNEYSRANSWTSNKNIAENIYKKIANRPTNKHWLSWMIDDYLPKDYPIKNILSVCCGTGMHEIILAKHYKNANIDAFDMSKESIKIARNKAASENISNIHFSINNINKLTKNDLNKSYDLILSTGAIHHVSSIEGVLKTLKEVLSKDGYFILNEFCGPSRHQWSDLQMQIVREITNLLPKEYLAKDAPLLRGQA